MTPLAHMPPQPPDFAAALGRPLGALLASALAAILTGCGGSGTSPAASATGGSATSLSSISPTALVAGQATTLSVSGVNLPLSAVLSLADGSCEAPTNVSASGLSVRCTPGSASSNSATLYSAAPSAGGYWLGQVALNVSAAPASTASTSLSLNDTGLGPTQCWAAGSDAWADCSSAAARALNAAQDGMVGLDVNTPSDSDGALGLRLALLGGQNACIKDQVSGLIWQRSSTVLSSLPTQLLSDAQALAASANSQQLCGLSDWRVPDRQELLSLLHLGGRWSALAVDADWISVAPGGVWQISNSLYGPNPANNGWLVSFARGDVSTLGSGGDGGVAARLVSGQRVEPSTRYTPSSDGSSVRDNRSGLVWQRCSAGLRWDGGTCSGVLARFSHEEALAYARDQTGWRLPNIKELASLNDWDANFTADQARQGPTIDLSAFPNTPKGTFWSATPLVEGPLSSAASQAWAADFASGAISPLTRSSFTSYLRLVQ